MGRLAGRRFSEKLEKHIAPAGETFVPAFLSPDQMTKFYDGFCNKTLWPLFHSFPMLTQYDDEYWRLYVEVNIEYCNRLAEIIQPGDIIFINDYHLMLLPRLLRDIFPQNQICFSCIFRFRTLNFFACCRKIGGRRGSSPPMLWAFTRMNTASTFCTACAEFWATNMLSVKLPRKTGFARLRLFRWASILTSIAVKRFRTRLMPPRRASDEFYRSIALTIPRESLIV